MAKEKVSAKSGKTKKKTIRQKEPTEQKMAMAEEPREDLGLNREIKEEKTEGKEKKGKKYFEAVGRRKTAIARVRLLTIKPFEGDEGKVTVNGKFYKEYFPILNLQQIAESALRRLKSLNRFEVVAKINGGGIRGQAEALRHGLAN